MNSTATEPIVVRHLSRSFRAVPRFEDVTFTVGVGRVVGLLGPNGAGKTTTIRMLLELFTPDAGEALVFGVPFRRLADPMRRIGAVLDAGGLHPGSTARQHLLIAAAQGFHPATRMDQVLGIVGMGSDADRRIRDYSLGTLQRVAVATALLGDPQILVLDGPAALRGDRAAYRRAAAPRGHVHARAGRGRTARRPIRSATISTMPAG